MKSKLIDEKLAEVLELLLSIDMEANIKDHLLDQLYKLKNDIGGILREKEEIE